MKKLVAFVLVVFVMLGMAACSGGNTPLSADDFEVYKNGRKVEMEWDSDSIRSISFLRLENSKDSDVTYATKRSIGIGDDVQAIIKKYDGNRVAVYDADIAESKAGRPEFPNLSAYVEDGTLLRNGEISFMGIFLNGQPVTFEEGKKAYNENSEVRLITYLLTFEIEKDMVADVGITAFQGIV